jgi:hypothetical protein
LVVSAPEFSPLKLLIEHRVEVYVVAEEWKHTKAEEIAYMERTGGRVCVSPRFTDLSTTEIKARLLAEHMAKENVLVSAVSAGVKTREEARKGLRKGLGLSA